MFGPICSSCLEFYLILFTFCPAIEGEELIFQKRKRIGALSLRTHFLYVLGVDIPKVLCSEGFHSPSKLWGTEHKDERS